MKLSILSVAEVEFSDAASYYEDAEPMLGEVFVEHVTRSINVLSKNPLIGHLIGKRVRKIALRKFPYSLIYVASDDEIVIVAIAHQSRKPRYWRDRLNGV
jgi:plasmid stabilization system protein ParE